MKTVTKGGGGENPFYFEGIQSFYPGMDVTELVVKVRLVPGAVIENLLTTSPSAATSLLVCYIYPTHFSETVSFQTERGTYDGSCAREHFELCMRLGGGKGGGKGLKIELHDPLVTKGFLRSTPEGAKIELKLELLSFLQCSSAQSEITSDTLFFSVH